MRGARSMLSASRRRNRCYYCCCSAFSVCSPVEKTRYIIADERGRGLRRRPGRGNDGRCFAAVATSSRPLILITFLRSFILGWLRSATLRGSQPSAPHVRRIIIIPSDNRRKTPTVVRTRLEAFSA